MAEAAVLAGFKWLASSPFLINLLKKGYSYLDMNMDEKLQDLEKITIPQFEMLIEAAENSPHRDRLRGWLKSLEDATYEAEDAPDLHDYYLLKQKAKSNAGGFVVRLESLPLIKDLLKNCSVALQNIKLRKSLMKLEKTAVKAREFRPFLPEGNSNVRGFEAAHESSRMVTTSLLAHKVFGLDKQRDKIIDFLHERARPEPESSFAKNYSVVAIVGLGGAGKTTLAQYVCDSEKEAKHFDVIMWVHVSQILDVERLTRKMVESASGKECLELTNLDTLQRKLEDSLRSKMFLLVLDDIWSEKEVAEVQWKQLLAPLSVGNRGSKILMTTRMKGATEALGARNILHLEELEQCDFLSLFMYYALGDAEVDNTKQYKELKEIVRQSAPKLHGSPLAVRMVGSRLRKRLNVDFWNRILNEDLLKDTMKSLLWSYQNLEAHLQRCFSYCSLFPKGRQIRRNELIHLWIAEGFIKTTDETNRIKDKGQEYFDDLLSSSFFQPTDCYDSYVMHDLLHDLAEMASKDRCLRIEGNLTKAIPREIRHLSICVDRSSDLAEKICNLKNLRTLIVFTSTDDRCIDDLLHNIFVKLKKLRVVDLKECVVKILPESIGGLKHLRHLDLRWSSFEFLPKSLSKLYHLEYLHIQKCTTVPKGLANLVNLRHLSDHDRMLSKVTGVSKLSSLQSLEYFEVKKESGHELKQLKNLRELQGPIHISGLENVEGKEAALEAKLEEKMGIERLRLEWSTTDRGSRSLDMDAQVLEGLCPPPQLVTLEIMGYQGRVCPSWMAEDRHLLRNLKFVELNECRQLEFLPDFANSYHELTDLVLRGLQRLKKLPILPPTLTKLVLDACPSLACGSKDDIDIIRSTQDKRISQAVAFLKGSAEQICWYSFPEQDSQGLCNWLERNIESIYQNLPVEEVQLAPPFSLQVLEITSCPLTDSILRECLRGLTSLTHLIISDIVCLTSLPSADVLGGLTMLQEVAIRRCWLLTSLGSLHALGSLKSLVISRCPGPFVELPAQGGDASLLPSSLESLQIDAWNSSNLDDLLRGATSLINLQVETCPSVESLQLCHLESLARLSIADCPTLGSLLGLQELERLQELTVKACPKLARAETKRGDTAGLRHLERFTTDAPSLLYALLTEDAYASLNCLWIEGFKEESMRPEEERMFRRLTSLKSLVFEDCCLTKLPDSLEGLSSLGILRICDCPNITSLPDLPRSLAALRLPHCNPVLKRRCQEPHGQDWPKIAHIPAIFFN